ncbi:MAG: ABC transporter transmembrane domain-containing protein, partial [Candidatus Methylopumilus sp.]|nr:ABC transporter transmembrane domain-containing protein [Candidatus Methylopumilus sp.]
MAKNIKKITASQPINFRYLYKRLFKYTWQHKFILSLSLVSLIVLSLTNTAFLAIIKKITDQGFGSEIADKQTSLALLLLLVMSIRALSGLFSSYFMKSTSLKVVESLRSDLFKKIMMLPMNFFDKNSSSHIVSKLNSDVQQLSNVISDIGFNLIKDGISFIGIVCYMIYLDWKLTLVFLLLAPILAYYLKIMSPRLRAAGTISQNANGELIMASDEAIAAQRIVKIFGTGQYEVSRFNKISEKIRKIQAKLIRIASLNSFTVEILAGVALSGIAFYSFGKFSAGQFAAFFAALLMIIAPIKSLTSINDKIQIAIAAAKSVFGLMDEPSEIDRGSKLINRAKGHIKISDLTFKYQNSKLNILEGINLIIKPGEKVALVGKSGGGKTTLINLLPRFYQIDQGKIFLDGININDLKLKNLRSQFSLVSQDTILFNDTIMNNIAYGNLERPVSLEEVKKAAIAANAWEFIDPLPNKLDHEIGDRGVRLSGGQRQRISIARAILKNAPILLLDEATSALDSHSEKYVQSA